MIAHNAETVQLEAVLFFALVDGVQQPLAALESSQAKFAIVAPRGDVIAVIGL